METRKIVFRGKDADNDHEWKYGSLIVCPDGSPVIVCFDDDGCELSYDVVPATVLTEASCLVLRYPKAHVRVTSE